MFSNVTPFAWLMTTPSLASLMICLLYTSLYCAIYRCCDATSNHGNRTWRHSRDPVSYTHLDVYKRQSKSSTTPTHTGTNDWASFGKLFFVIASRSILFSVLSIFIPILYITVINGEASASSLALTMYFAMGAVLTYMGGALSDKLGFLKTVRLGNLIFLPSVLVFIFVPNIWGFFGAMIPMAFGVFSQYGPITVLGQKYLAKNAGFASGVTLGLGITLGAVSYTHLDVYKRQILHLVVFYRYVL